MSFEIGRIQQIKLAVGIVAFWLIMPLIVIPIALVEKRYNDIFIELSIYIPLCVVVIGQFILLRKYYLGKVFVNEDGVGYNYKNKVYKFFKWEEIIKVKIGQAYFVFYKSEKVNRGKNIVEMKYHVTRKNEMQIFDLCKDICKLITLKQEKYNFQIQTLGEYSKKLFEQKQ